MSELGELFKDVDIKLVRYPVELITARGNVKAFDHVFLSNAPFFDGGLNCFSTDRRGFAYLLDCVVQREFMRDGFGFVEFEVLEVLDCMVL